MPRSVMAKQLLRFIHDETAATGSTASGLKIV